MGGEGARLSAILGTNLLSESTSGSADAVRDEIDAALGVARGVREGGENPQLRGVLHAPHLELRRFRLGGHLHDDVDSLSNLVQREANVARRLVPCITASRL